MGLSLPLRGKARVTVLFLVLVTGGMLLSARAMATNEPARTGYTFEALGNVSERPSRELPSRPEAPVSGQNVQGFDERIQVFDTTVPNLRTVAYLELYDEFGEFLGSCSGTFIGPDAVLTAAHCLWSADGGWTGDVVVVPAKNGDFEPYGWDFASDYWVPDQWIDENENSDYDWGIIKLPDYSLSNLVGWRPLGSFGTSTLESDDIIPAIVGYPGDKPDGTMWIGAKEWFLTVADEWFAYDIDTAGGMSGSAILSIGTNPKTQGYIVGIHTTGAPGENYGVRVRPDLIADLDIGCIIMECTFAYYEEPIAPTPTPTRTATPTVTATPTSVASGIALVSWKFCYTSFVCNGNQRISQGDTVQAQFVLSSVPTGEVSIDVHYGLESNTFTYSPPYVGPGFVTGDAIGEVNAQGEITIDVYVGAEYVGSFSTVVRNPLNFRMFSWGLARP